MVSLKFHTHLPYIGHSISKFIASVSVSSCLGHIPIYARRTRPGTVHHILQSYGLFVGRFYFIIGNYEYATGYGHTEFQKKKYVLCVVAILVWIQFISINVKLLPNFSCCVTLVPPTKLIDCIEDLCGLYCIRSHTNRSIAWRTLRRIGYRLFISDQYITNFNYTHGLDRNRQIYRSAQ